MSENNFEELQNKLEAQKKEFQRLYQAHLVQNKENQMLRRINHLYTQIDQLDDNLEIVMDLALEIIPAEAGGILLIDVESSELFFKVMRGPKAKEVAEFRIASDVGIAGHAFTHQQTLAVSDVSNDPRHYKEISEKIGFETRSIIAVPMQFATETFGVIEVINKKEQDSFASAEIEILELLAQSAGNLIELALRLQSGAKE